MIFADLVAGDEVFVDANTLIYHCTLDPMHGIACTDLLDRIGRGEIRGHTSTHILGEVAHRLMGLEAAKLLGNPKASTAKYLKSHLTEIKRLTGFCQAIQDLCLGTLNILTIPAAMIPVMATLSQQIGLLTNDALLVAVMQANGLTKLASNDPDFDHVLGITRYGLA
jgi:predicted nucleic acid-binding protein